MKKQLHKFCLTLILAIGLTSTTFATRDTLLLFPDHVEDNQGWTLTTLSTNIGDTLFMNNQIPTTVIFQVSTTTFTIPAGGTFTYVVVGTDAPNFNITYNIPFYGNRVFPINVNASTTSIKEATDNVQFNAFPNPVKDLLTLKSPNALGTVKVYSITGKLVFTEIVKESETNIDVSAFSPGMYFVENIMNGKKIVTKLLKD